MATFMMFLDVEDPDVRPILPRRIIYTGGLTSNAIVGVALNYLCSEMVNSIL